MYRRDYSDLEDQIIGTVKSAIDAIDAIDFINLKKEFTDKTEDTFTEVKDKFKIYTEKIESKYREVNKRKNNDIAKYIIKKPKGNISSMIYMIFGGLGTFIFGLVSFVLLISMLFVGLIKGVYISFLLFSIFLLASLILLFRGMNSRKRIGRFKKYVAFMGEKRYIKIQELAKITREKEEFVIKDLNKMIDLGMFLEGHIDDEKTYFMLNDEVYNYYLNLKKQMSLNENNKKTVEEKKENEVDNIIVIGREYISQIRNVRNSIYRDELSDKLNKLENVATQILNYVEKNPNKKQDVNKFINHYLPITIKLITSYKELNSQIVQGENIKNAKTEIKKSIDLINTAFENLLDDLYEDTVLDISTDISVLKTLFKQEGLTEEDFKK